MIKNLFKNILLVLLLSVVVLPCQAMKRRVRDSRLKLSSVPAPFFVDNPTITYDATLSLSAFLRIVIGLNEQVVASFEKKMVSLGLLNFYHLYPGYFDPTTFKNPSLARFFTLLNEEMVKIFGYGVVTFADNSANQDSAFIRIIIKDKVVNRTDYDAIDDVNLTPDNVMKALAILLEHSTKKPVLLKALSTSIAGLEKMLSKPIPLQVNKTPDEDDLSWCCTEPGVKSGITAEGSEKLSQEDLHREAISTLCTTFATLRVSPLSDKQFQRFAQPSLEIVMASPDSLRARLARCLHASSLPVE